VQHNHYQKHNQKQRQRPGKKVVRILMLEKTESAWTHTNFITNWKDVVAAVDLFEGTAVTSIVPHRTPFGDQVRLYRQADVVISLWGGISMLNFLMPPGGVEVLFTSWFAPMMPMPVPGAVPISASTSRNTTSTTTASGTSSTSLLPAGHLVCPDFEDIARLSLGTTKSLRFCSRTNGMNATTIDIANFLPLVQLAVSYVRWKKGT
jgi:hypothetical protein